MCQLTVNLTNNSGQGYVTYNSATNGVGSPPVSQGNPPLIGHSVGSGETKTILNVVGGEYYAAMPGTGAGWQALPSEGNVSFNIPNGTAFTIDWNLSPGSVSSDDVRFENVDPSYKLVGDDNPTISLNHITYNLHLQLND